MTENQTREKVLEERLRFWRLLAIIMTVIAVAGAILLLIIWSYESAHVPL